MAVSAAVRTFEPADLDACLRVFDTNVPRFFTTAERDAFRSFLAALPGPYFVLAAADGLVLGCGGYAVRADASIADLCWGMVRQDHQGSGLGRLLTEARLARIRLDERVTEIALNTSQHTAGFYARLGFVTVEVVRDAYAPGLDRCEMRLRLDRED